MNSLPVRNQSLRLGKLLVAGSRAYEIGASVVLMAIVSRLLAPAEFAHLGLFVAFTQLAVWIFLSPLQNYMLVNASVFVREKLFGHHLAFVTLLAVCVSGLSLFVVTRFIDYFSFASGNEIFILALFGTILASILYQTVLPAVNICGHKVKYALLNALAASVSLVLPAALCLVWPSYEYWVVGLSVSQIAIVVIALLIVPAMMQLQGSFTSSLNFRRMLVFGVPLSVAVFFQWCLVQGYRFVLEPYITLEMLGGFLMAFTFSGRFFNAAEKIINVVLLPDLYTAKHKQSAWKAFFIKSSIVYSMLFIVLAISVKFLFKFLIGSEYQFAAVFLMAGLAYDFLRILLNAVFQLYLAQEKTWMQLIVSILMACTLIVALGNGLSAGHSMQSLQYVFPCVLGMGVIAGLVLSRREFCR